MKSFQWGSFDQLLDVVALEDRGAQLVRDRSAGIELGRLDLGPEVGRGSVEYLSSDSLRVVLLDCNFEREQVVSILDDGWLRLNFGLDLYVDMTLGEDTKVQARESAWRFIRLPENQASIEVLPSDTRLRWVTVCCRPELLRDVAGMDVAELLSLADSTDHTALVHRCFSFTPRLQRATADMFASDVSGRMRVPLVATKAQELLLLAVDQMLRSAGTTSSVVRLSDRDIKALYAIRSFVDENLGNVPNAGALSRNAGMNRTKLYYGFKKIFGVSLSRHIQERRIEEGYRLLTTTDASMGDIAARVGFRHQCNFSTAFKARYGFAPNSARRSKG